MGALAAFAQRREISPNPDVSGPFIEEGAGRGELAYIKVPYEGNEEFLLTAASRATRKLPPPRKSHYLVQERAKGKERR